MEERSSRVRKDDGAGEGADEEEHLFGRVLVLEVPSDYGEGMG